MARHAIARVVDGQLIWPAADVCKSLPLVIGSKEWSCWLEAVETRSFAYHSTRGTLTARREQRPAGWYWYGYRRQGGRLYKVYLGKTEDLTEERLEEAVSRLNRLPRLPIPSQRSTEGQRGSLAADAEFLVSRPRLLHWLEQSTRQQLTLLCAPAGSGKTTLLRQWINWSGRMVARVDLQREDSEPRHFLRTLMAALQPLCPTSGEGRIGKLIINPTLALEEVIDALIADLAALPAEATIILDNYQLINNKFIHDALKGVLTHLSSRIHLVIASRSDPPLSLARLRLCGQISELRAPALRFSCEEVRALFHTLLPEPLSDEECDLVQQRTEGWAAALRMVGLALHEREDRAHFVTTFSGSHRYLLSYLLEEVLEDQPERVQTFLLHTCILDRFNGSLCRAVIAQDDAPAILEKLEQADLFVVPLDKARHWYRYHYLFAEALRHHLECTQPDLLPALHERASDWFAAHGYIKDAITHALAAHVMERAGELIEQVAPGMVENSEIALLQTWLSALPNSVLQASPRLCIAAAWMLLLSKQAGTYLHWLDTAEQALSARTKEEQPGATAALQAEIIALRAMYEIARNDFARAIAICRQALGALPPENLYARSLVLMSMGMAYYRGADAGDVGAAAQALAEASSAVQSAGHALLLPMVKLCQAELYFAQGQPLQAAMICRQVLKLVAEWPVYPLYIAGVAHAWLGRLCYDWNDLEAAREHLLKAWEMGKRADSTNVLFQSAFLLASVSQAQGKPEEAEAWMQHLEALAQDLNFIDGLRVANVMRTGLALAQGHLEEALLQIQTSIRHSEDNDCHDDDEYLTRARVYIAAARTFADSAYARQALALLERQRRAAEAAGMTRLVMEILILQAQALQLQDHLAGALDTLERAVHLAEPGGYIRIFVDEGEAVSRLLCRLLGRQRRPKMQNQTINLAYVRKLLAAFPQQPSLSQLIASSERQTLPELLSQREYEVLRLMAAGRTNREIARELVVVIGTVKAHINSIYRKLAVNNRIQAIARARALHLL
jgi:LuxR family maltose regulon positive regulatory protein